MVPNELGAQVYIGDVPKFDNVADILLQADEDTRLGTMADILADVVKQYKVGVSRVTHDPFDPKTSSCSSFTNPSHLRGREPRWLATRILLSVPSASHTATALPSTRISSIRTGDLTTRGWSLSLIAIGFKSPETAGLLKKMSAPRLSRQMSERAKPPSSRASPV